MFGVVLNMNSLLESGTIAYNVYQSLDDSR